MFMTDNEKLVAALKWVLVSFSCYNDFDNPEGKTFVFQFLSVVTEKHKDELTEHRKSFSFFQLLHGFYQASPPRFPVLVSFSCYDEKFELMAMLKKFQFLSVVTRAGIKNSRRTIVLVSFSCYVYSLIRGLTKLMFQFLSVVTASVHFYHGFLVLFQFLSVVTDPSRPRFTRVFTRL